jgi:hypothetical protein
MLAQIVKDLRHFLDKVVQMCCAGGKIPILRSNVHINQ